MHKAHQSMAASSEIVAENRYPLQKEVCKVELEMVKTSENQATVGKRVEKLKFSPERQIQKTCGVGDPCLGEVIQS